MLKLLLPSNLSTASPTKCGEIYHNLNDFTIFCTICQMKSFHFDDFLQHVRNVHLGNNLYQTEATETKELNECLEITAINEAELCEIENSMEKEYLEENLANETELCKTEDALKNCIEIDYLQENLENEATLCETTYILESYTDISEFDVESCSDEKNFMISNKLRNKRKLKKRKRFNSEIQDVNNEESTDELEFQNSFLENCTEQTLDISEFDMESFSEEDNVTISKKATMDIKNEKSVTKIENVDNPSHHKNEKPKSEKANKPLEYSCPECQQIFVLKKYLDNHVIEFHKGYKCSLCDARFQYTHHLRRHELKHNPETKFSCPIEECTKVYNDRDNLKRHVLSHNPDQYFACPVAECKKIYINLRNFEKHQNTQHKYSQTYVNKFVCDVCGYTCQAEAILIIHQRRHTGEKPFPCDFCEKRFVSKSALNAHMANHSSTRPYVCKICHASFARSGILQRHLFLHSDEKKFKCKICDKAFKQPQCLDGHMRRLHMEPKARTDENKK